MKLKMPSRHTLSASIIIFYLAPLFALCFYSMGWMTYEKSWKFISLGLFSATVGSLCLILILYYWEQSIFQSHKSNPLTLLTFSKNSAEEKSLKVTPLESTDHFNEVASVSTEEDLTPPPFLKSSFKVTQDEYEALENQLLSANQQIEKNEEENLALQMQIEKITQDFADYKLFSEEQLKQKQAQLQNFQQLADDHRTEMEKRQEHIHQLDSKIHDLSYEIKTLLYLSTDEIATPAAFSASAKPMDKYRPPKREALNFQEEGHAEIKEKGILITEIFGPGSPVANTKEASAFLKKLVEMAEKITGASRYGNESSRYREFSSTHYSFDQRRLFDLLKNETSALVVVCTPKEQKTLFVNNLVNEILGWNPEKFVSDFNQILEDSLHEWNHALASVSTASECQTRVLAKTRQGKEVLLNCHLTIIPTGLFRLYTLAVLYPI